MTALIQPHNLEGNYNADVALSQNEFDTPAFNRPHCKCYIFLRPSENSSPQRRRENSRQRSERKTPVRLCARVLLQVDTAEAEYPAASGHQMKGLDPAERPPGPLLKFVRRRPPSSALNRPATQLRDQPPAADGQTSSRRSTVHASVSLFSSPARPRQSEPGQDNPIAPPASCHKARCYLGLQMASLAVFSAAAAAARSPDRGLRGS